MRDNTSSLLMRTHNSQSAGHLKREEIVDCAINKNGLPNSLLRPCCYPVGNQAEMCWLGSQVLANAYVLDFSVLERKSLLSPKELLRCFSFLNKCIYF